MVNSKVLVEEVLDFSSNTTSLLIQKIRSHHPNLPVDTHRQTVQTVTKKATTHQTAEYATKTLNQFHMFQFSASNLKTIELRLRVNGVMQSIVLASTT